MLEPIPSLTGFWVMMRTLVSRSKLEYFQGTHLYSIAHTVRRAINPPSGLRENQSKIYIVKLTVE